MKDFGPFAVAIAFWIFVMVCAVAGIVADYKRRRAALEPLRAAIERGQPLDPTLLDRLMAPERDAGINPLHLQVGGIITLSAGAGIALLAFFLYPVAPDALFPVLGGGAVVVCVGLGLVIAARAVARHRASQGNDIGDERQQVRRAG